MKKTVVLLAVILFCGGVAQSAPIVGEVHGASVQTLFHIPTDNQMTLRVTNASTKNITGYILSIHVLSADGQKTDFHSMYDFLANQLLLASFEGTVEEDNLRSQIGPSFLTPGQNYDQVSAMPVNLQDFSVMVTAVAYSDKSAEAISKDELEPLIEQREAEETAIRKANEIISANPDPQVAIKKIQNLRDVSAASSHSTIEINEHTLDVIIEDLQANPNLKAYQAKKERERAVWADHAKLKIGGAS